MFQVLHTSQLCVILECSEFKRRLDKQGDKFKRGKGSHLHVELNANHSVFPFHGVKEYMRCWLTPSKMAG